MGNEYLLNPIYTSFNASEDETSDDNTNDESYEDLQLFLEESVINNTNSDHMSRKKEI